MENTILALFLLISSTSLPLHVHCIHVNVYVSNRQGFLCMRVAGSLWCHRSQLIPHVQSHYIYAIFFLFGTGVRLLSFGNSIVESSITNHNLQLTQTSHRIISIVRINFRILQVFVALLRKCWLLEQNNIQKTSFAFLAKADKNKHG